MGSWNRPTGVATVVAISVIILVAVIFGVLREGIVLDPAVCCNQTDNGTSTFDAACGADLDTLHVLVLNPVSGIQTFFIAIVLLSLLWWGMFLCYSGGSRGSRFHIGKGWMITITEVVVLMVLITTMMTTHALQKEYAILLCTDTARRAMQGVQFLAWALALGLASLHIFFQCSLEPSKEAGVLKRVLATSTDTTVSWRRLPNDQVDSAHELNGGDDDDDENIIMDNIPNKNTK